MKKLLINLCFFSAFFLPLLLSFYSNFFGVADWPHLLKARIQRGCWHDGKNWFRSFETYSESLVVARVVQSRKTSLSYNGGFMGRFQHSHLATDSNARTDVDINYQYSLLERENIPSQDIYIPYPSQPGGSGMLFSIIDALLRHTASIEQLHMFNATLSALALAGICFIFAKEFGLVPAIFVWAVIFLSGWITVFGRNLYWVIWTFYAPFLLVWLALFREFRLKEKPNLYIFYLLVWCALFCRFLCGLEYCTTVLISTTIPVFYYAIEYKVSFKNFLKRFVALSLTGLVSLSCALAVWLLQLYGLFQSTSLGLALLKFTAGKRSVAFAGNHSIAFNELLAQAHNSDIAQGLSLMLAQTCKICEIPIFVESLQASVYEVLKIYMSRGFWSFIILLLICTVAIIWSKRFEKYRALWTATAVSLLAPISWFILAKPHSYVHTHLNYLLWFIPFIPLLFVLIGKLTQELFVHFTNKYKT